MDRIVNLQYETCPKLFKYILMNKRNIVLDRWKLIYIHVEEKEIKKLVNIDSLKEEIEKVLSSPICFYCGTRATGGLLLNYREQSGCIGRITNCPICFLMADKHFYKFISLKEKEKEDKLRSFISELA